MIATPPAARKPLFAKISLEDLQKSLEIRIAVFNDSYPQIERKLLPLFLTDDDGSEQTLALNAEHPEVAWMLAVDDEFGHTSRAVQMRTLILLEAARMSQIESQGLVIKTDAGFEISHHLMLAVADMDIPTPAKIKPRHILRKLREMGVL